MEVKIKRKFKIIATLLIVISSFFTLGTKVQAKETSSQVTYSYVDWDNLNSNQQKNIIKGTPSEIARYDREYYQLVYKKLATKTPKSNGQNLPKTNDNETPKWIYFLGFSSLFIVVLLLFWKRKALKEMMLLLIIVGGLVTNIHQDVNAAEVKWPNDLTVTINKNESMHHVPEDINGYTYVGYLHSSSNDKDPVVGANVTAKYVDDQGNTISDNVVLTGNVGDTYTTEQKEIAGYTCKEVQGNKTGTFTDAEQTVTYVYTKEKDGLVEFVLNDKNVEESINKEIIVWKNNNKKVYNILYYVWNKDDINSKITDLSLSGKVGDSVEIPSSYENVYHPKNIYSEDSFSVDGVKVYAVYQDDLGELQFAPDYYTFYVNVDDYDNKPSQYMSEKQSISLNINYFLEP